MQERGSDATVAFSMVAMSDPYLRRLVAASGIAALVGGAVFAMAFAMARHSFIHQGRERLELAVGAAEGHVLSLLHQALDTLQRIADELPVEGAAAGSVVLSERVVPRAMRGAVVTDGSGVVRGTVPRGALLDLPTEAVAAVVASAHRSGATAWAPSTERVTGLDVLLVALPAGSGLGDPARATTVVGVVDPNELRRALVGDSWIRGQGLLLLARGGELVAAVGHERPAAGRLEELLPGSEPAAARERLALGNAPKGVMVAEWGGRREKLLATARVVEGVPGQWAVAGVLPLAATLEAGRAVFLVWGVGAAALIALWIAFAVASARSEEGRRAAVAEAERVKRLAARTDLEARCRFLVEHAAMPLLLLRDEEVVALSPSAEREFGEARRWAILGRQATDLVAAAEREAVARFLFEPTAAGGAGRTLRAIFRVPGGRQLAAELVVSELGQAAGGPVFRAVAVRDLERSSRCQALLDVLSASDPRAVMVLDLDGKITWVNDTFCEQSGLRRDDVLQREGISLVVGADRRRALALFGAALRGQARSTVVRVNVAGGRGVLVQVHALPMHTEGVALGVVVTGRETHGGAVAGSLGEGKVGEVVARLGSAVAHRLGNDFQALLGLLERVRQEGTVAPYYEEMKGLLATATGEVQRLLAVSRVGASGLRVLRLGGLVERWARGKAPTLPPSLRLSVRREVRDDRVVGDALQLAMVLDLALEAARTALVHGGGAVEVVLEEGQEAGTVRLRITDTGEVLSGDEKEAAEPVLASREATVALAEVVARRHGGRSGFRQRPGLGNRLWLDLPLHRGRREEIAAPPAPRGGAILLADDEDLVRETLAAALRERGHEVVEAGDGAAVLDLVRQEPQRFALVVLDLLMPKLGGRDAYLALRTLAPDLEVLVCTGYEPADDEVLRGADAIIKPFSIDDFVARVEEMLGRTGRGDGLGGSMLS